MRHLRADVEGQVLAALVPHGDAAAGLDRQVGLAMLREDALDHAMGLAHLSLHIAMRGVLMRQQIGKQRFIHARRLRVQCLPHRGHRRQHLIVHRHLLGRVLGGVAVARDDAGDRIALEPHLVDRQRVHLHRLQAFDRRRHPVPRGPSRHVLAGEDGDHAGHLEGGLQIDGGDARMGMGRAHETSVQRTRNVDVVDVAPVPGQQALVLLARRVRADVAELLFRHRLSPPASVPPRAGSPRRCSGSRCSGTGCPTARRGSVPRSGRGCP